MLILIKPHVAAFGLILIIESVVFHCLLNILFPSHVFISWLLFYFVIPHFCVHASFLSAPPPPRPGAPDP